MSGTYMYDGLHDQIQRWVEKEAKEAENEEIQKVQEAEALKLEERKKKREEMKRDIEEAVRKATEGFVKEKKIEEVIGILRRIEGKVDGLVAFVGELGVEEI